MFLKEKDRIKKLLNGKLIVSFSPFQYCHPVKRYFAEYKFIEEGFSAYTNKQHYSTLKAKLKEIFKVVFINVRFPFQSKNVKGFLIGSDFSCKASKKYEIIVCSEDAFNRGTKDGLLQKCIVPISEDMKGESHIKDSYVLVMDRLNPIGRPYEKDNYLAVLKDFLLSLQSTNKQFFAKIHPSDFGNDVVKEELIRFFLSTGLNIEIIEDNLEIIALSDNNNTFIGTNSTIQYYAPIFGRSNKSISFARLLAQVDSKYASFLEGWGGVDEFCYLFSKQVKCI